MTAESNYRRGVILGLTMAEVLILLLFLLLMALGSQIVQKQREIVQLRQSISLLDGGRERLNNAQLVARLETLNAKLNRYEKAFPDLSRLEALQNALSEAAKRNPGDPAAELEAAIHLRSSLLDIAELQTAGIAGSAEYAAYFLGVLRENGQLKSRLEAAAAAFPDEEALAQLSQLGDALRSIDPDAPPQDLKQVLNYYLEIKKGLMGSELAVSPPEKVAEMAKKAQDEVSAAGSANVDKGKNPWPPMIQLSEADGFFFEKGSAELTPEFRSKLTQEIPVKLLELLAEYDVDVVEVVGHTDEQPISSRSSNLDDVLLSVLRGKASEASLQPADNAGLGLSRAVAVVKILSADRRLGGVNILPFSAAQLIDSNGKLTVGIAGDIRERRRIEIRLRGRGEPGASDSGLNLR